VVFRFDPSWGFRSAAETFYKLYPEHFVRRLPPQDEGIWVAFDSLSPIANISDFSIKIHEIGFNAPMINYDNTIGAKSLRYVLEPLLNWMPINTAGVNDTDYASVLNWVNQRWSGTSDFSASITLSSGTWDEQGKYIYTTGVRSWCNGTQGCACFQVSPLPELDPSPYAYSKASYYWNDAARNVYFSSGLDGEFLDSFTSVFGLDFRRSNHRASVFPVTFATKSAKTTLPLVFQAITLGRDITNFVRNNVSKIVLANGGFDSVWGTDIVDLGGSENKWFNPGTTWNPPSAARLTGRRLLAFQRPYCQLIVRPFPELSFLSFDPRANADIHFQNEDFSLYTPYYMEQYFGIAMLYGIYPSFFSPTAGPNTFWSQPNLYNPARPLFRKYIPLIKRANSYGWQPVTYAVASSASVLMERFGENAPNLAFTIRNTASSIAAVPIQIDARAIIGAPGTLVGTAAFAFLNGYASPVSGALSISSDKLSANLTVTIPALTTELFAISYTGPVGPPSQTPQPPSGGSNTPSGSNSPTASTSAPVASGSPSSNINSSSLRFAASCAFFGFTAVLIVL
jgi:hypothetical protein